MNKPQQFIMFLMLLAADCDQSGLSGQSRQASASPATTQSVTEDPPASTDSTPSQPDTAVDELLQQAVTKGDAGDFRAALELGQRAATLAPADPRPLLVIARAAVELQERDVGLKAFDAAVALQPALSERAQALRLALEAIPSGLVATAPETGVSANSDAAAKQLQLALQTTELLVKMAEHAVAEQQLKEAEELLDRAMESLAVPLIDPEQSNMEVWRLAGLIAVLKGDCFPPGLGPFAFEAISRLHPQYDDDPQLMKIMVALNGCMTERTTKEMREVARRAALAAGGSEAEAADFAQKFLSFKQKVQAIPAQRDCLLKDLKLAAEKADWQAMYRVGAAYCLGEGAPTNHLTGAHWLLRAYRNGDAGAAMYLSSWDEENWGDIAEVTEESKGRFMAEAVARLNADKRFQQLVPVAIGDEPRAKAAAIEELVNLAKTRDVKTIACVHGFVLQRDHKQGLELMTFAAEQGSEFVMVALGDLYRDGKVVGRDLAAAQLWYGRASHAGYLVGTQRLNELAGQ